MVWNLKYHPIIQAVGGPNVELQSTEQLLRVLVLPCFQVVPSLGRKMMHLASAFISFAPTAAVCLFSDPQVVLRNEGASMLVSSTLTQ